MEMTKKEFKKQQKAKMKEIKKFNAKMYKKYNKEKKLKNVPESYYTTTMSNEDNILEFHNLQTHFFTDTGTVKAVDGVSFNIPKGSTVGVVGESGCGKSVTSLSIMRLLQGPQGQIVGGEIRFNNKNTGKAIDITRLPMSEMQKIRGNEISMIFQEPMTSLNPVFTIGAQLAEPIELHNPKMKKKEVEVKVIELLKLVGIADAEGVINRYPHELSGGMKQRIVIAMALPGEISDHVKYSGKEYYKSRCEEKYIDREFDSLHDYLNLYHLQGEDYGIYWEMVNGYEDYAMYMNYKSMEDQENISFSYIGENDQPQEISFITSQKIEEYRNKVLENAENVKYERNKRYFTEFAQKAQ